MAADGAVIVCTLPPPSAGQRKSFAFDGASALNATNAKDRATLKKAERFVRAFVSGSNVLPDVPVTLPSGTDFQRSVWRQLLRIPAGSTVTYAEMAARAGYPRACRAAGQACGANPIPLFIPCHRVLAANGRLGGFSGGLAWKRLLLTVEGVSFREATTTARRDA